MRISVYLLNGIIMAAIVAIFVSSLVAHFQIPWLGILAGFIAGCAVPRLIFSKKWNEVKSTNSNGTTWGILSVASLIGSQMGWTALLI